MLCPLVPADDRSGCFERGETMNISAYRGFNPYQYPNPVQAAAAGYGKNLSAVDQSVGRDQESYKVEISSAREAGAIECSTCRQRRYQDVSNDPGVSFKAPGYISPEASYSMVKSHELEHVRNEAAKASREDRKIVSQSVTLKTSVCPECGRVYISGGETRTVTKGNVESPKKDYFSARYNMLMNKSFGTRLDIRV